jgi:GNAT superfamily N-acetyltransferase
VTVELLPVRTQAELERWTAVHNAAVARSAHSVDDVAAYRDALERGVHLLALLDGQEAAAGFAGREPGRPAGLGEAQVAVLAGNAGRGLGSALLAALSRWASAEGVSELQGHVEEDDERALAWTARRGFAEVGRESLLELALQGLEPPHPALPAGIAVVTLAERPELAQGIYEVAREAYPDIPGFEDDEMEPFDDWLAHELGGPGDRPEATFVALAGDEVVGFSKFHLSEARPGTAMHDVTGVARAWRGRGIAGALKRTQIAWALDAGYERLETMNEVRNIPIRRLNERLGYRLAPGRVLVRGPLWHSGADALQS